MSVDFYNFAHFDDPIVEGLIMNSGSALLPIRSADTSHSNFSFVASQVGCGNQAHAAAELACMRGVPAQTLEQFVGIYQELRATPGITFAPIADGKVVFANYTERALEGKLANVVSHRTFQESQWTGADEQPAGHYRYKFRRWGSVRALQSLRPESDDRSASIT